MSINVFYIYIYIYIYILMDEYVLVSQCVHGWVAKEGILPPASFKRLRSVWKSFHFDLFDVVRFQYSQVSFSLSVLILSSFGSSIASVMYSFPLLIINMVHFSCQIPFLYLGSMFLLPVSGFPILFHFWETV